MQYFLGLVLPGSAETDSKCGGKLDSSLIDSCVIYWCQKLSKSDNASSNDNRKCLGCFFFPDMVHYTQCRFYIIFLINGTAFYLLPTYQ